MGRYRGRPTRLPRPTCRMAVGCWCIPAIFGRTSPLVIRAAQTPRRCHNGRPRAAYGAHGRVDHRRNDPIAHHRRPALTSAPAQGGATADLRSTDSGGPLGPLFFMCSSVRFGSKADIIASAEKGPLSGVKRTLLGELAPLRRGFFLKSWHRNWHRTGLFLCLGRVYLRHQ